jgi:ADP-ribosylation factor-like protein 6
MGLFSMLAKAFGWSKKQVQVIVIGLDNSGKSTILNALKPKSAAKYEMTPTVGYKVEGFEKGNLRFNAFDMSGQGRFRALWEAYYKEVQAVIFVVDSTDKIRMSVAKDELEQLLAHKDIEASNIPILFFANKMDLPGALPPTDIMSQLNLASITSKPWHISASNALRGEGLDEGMEWLATAIGKLSLAK